MPRGVMSARWLPECPRPAELLKLRECVRDRRGGGATMHSGLLLPSSTEALTAGGPPTSTSLAGDGGGGEVVGSATAGGVSIAAGACLVRTSGERGLFGLLPRRAPRGIMIR